jgi:glycosyltransferase involved in cell wall biosynthesis
MTKIFRRSPLVTVILPSFNHAPYVAAAVSSVLNQSLHELELIVVDDASTDETPDIVASFKDPRLKLLRLETNRAVHPRNLALSLAQGRYIAFQNSDDIWRPEKLAKQVAMMESADAPSICFTHTGLVGPDSLPATGTWLDGIFDFTDRPPAEWLRRFFDQGNCLSITSAMVRRKDLVALGGFRGSLIQLGDFDLWIRLAARGPFRCVPEELTLYRVTDGNLSGPAQGAQLRVEMELSQVLESYMASPILERLHEVFPDIPAEAPTGARKLSLARRANLRPGSAYPLFADRVIASILENPQERAEAVEHHGASFINEFIARRARSEFRIL